MRRAAHGLALVAGLMALAGAGGADPPAEAGAAVHAALAVLAPRPRGEGGAERCTADGAHCIRLASYVEDVCGVIEATAEAHALDPHFFARLIWRESLFDAGAVSPAGAQGIAQFMPDTARIRGLRDPLNPAEALRASAAYLAEMAGWYGNLGLAAVGYNGGEARAERFIAGAGGLPGETRAYVLAITGHSAETWRDAPPDEPDLRLAPEGGFRDACVAQAARRSIRQFPTVEPLRAWGVILASNAARQGAEREAARLRHRHAAVLGGEEVSYSHARAPGIPRRLHMAQIGRDSRAEAERLCARLRADGGACMVLRN